MNRRSFLGLAATLPLLPASMTFAAPRILVIGDSVAWGQGLRFNQKMHTLLARMLFSQNGVEPSVLHYAHSGATIGFENGVPTPPSPAPDWWPREIPRANPTLYEQCHQVAADHQDQRFDVILLTGGINDVRVETIFNPKTSEYEIRQRTAMYCGAAMRLLLGELQTRYVTANPNVRILLLGYYSVLSTRSLVPNIYDVLRVLAQETLNPPRPTSTVDAYSLEMKTMSLQNKLTRNSLAFHDASRADLSAAVASANGNDGRRTNFYFVDPMITDDEAAFAPDAVIWGLDHNERPEDPLYNDRLEYCGNLLKKHPGVDRFTCDRASLWASEHKRGSTLRSSGLQIIGRLRT